MFSYFIKSQFLCLFTCRAVHVLYVATIEGLIKKISVLTRTQKTCVLEVWRPYPVDVPNQSILSLRYLKETVSKIMFFYQIVFKNIDFFHYSTPFSLFIFHYPTLHFR